jgi:hypothetical protein
MLRNINPGKQQTLFGNSSRRKNKDQANSVVTREINKKALFIKSGKKGRKGIIFYKNNTKDWLSFCFDYGALAIDLK